MWEATGWDEKSWDEVRWGEKSSHDLRWDDVWEWLHQGCESDLSTDFLHFGANTFPFTLPFEKCFKIVFLLLWRRDPVVELQFPTPLPRRSHCWTNWTRAAWITNGTRAKFQLPRSNCSWQTIVSLCGVLAVSSIGGWQTNVICTIDTVVLVWRCRPCMSKCNKRIWHSLVQISMQMSAAQRCVWLLGRWTCKWRTQTKVSKTYFASVIFCAYRKSRRGALKICCRLLAVMGTKLPRPWDEGVSVPKPSMFACC